MLGHVAQAKADGADLIIFPELSIPGYLIGDNWDYEAFLRECEACGKELISAARGIAIIFGNVAVDWQKVNRDGHVRKYNALFAAQEERLVAPEGGLYPYCIKTLQPNYREFDDSRYFFSTEMLALEQQETVENLLRPIKLELGGKAYNIGCFICEDGWSENYSYSPIELLCKREKLDFVVNISASPYTLGKNRKRHEIFAAHAQKTGVPLFYANQTGVQNNGKSVYAFDGSGAVYTKEGKLLAVSERFLEKLLYVKWPLEKEGTVPLAEEEPKVLYEALIYAMQHFIAQLGLKKVVIGISGGIDSAVAAALYVRVLGKENVLLVNMPSIYNSNLTKSASQKLAQNLGCAYAIVPIQEAVEHTIRQFENIAIAQNDSVFPAHLKIAPFVAENIQARDRSARILAGIAAAVGAVFSCNANKAEMTVGYSTLYGDLGGFLAVLGDVWKHQVYALAEYINAKVFGQEIIPRQIIEVVPSAELSAAQDVEKGMGDPLLYPYHDYLFASFMQCWQKAAPEDILRWYEDGILEEQIGCQKGLVKKYFPGAKEFIADLEHWWSLFSGMGVAKRIQAPPILAISGRAYGFDQREAQMRPYYTRQYLKLKERLLNE